MIPKPLRGVLRSLDVASDWVFPIPRLYREIEALRHPGRTIDIPARGTWSCPPRTLEELVAGARDTLESELAATCQAGAINVGSWHMDHDPRSRAHAEYSRGTVRLRSDTESRIKRLLAGEFREPFTMDIALIREADEGARLVSDTLSDSGQRARRHRDQALTRSLTSRDIAAVVHELVHGFRDPELREVDAHGAGRELEEGGTVLAELRLVPIVIRQLHLDELYPDVMDYRDIGYPAAMAAVAGVVASLAPFVGCTADDELLRLAGGGFGLLSWAGLLIRVASKVVPVENSAPLVQAMLRHLRRELRGLLRQGREVSPHEAIALGFLAADRGLRVLSTRLATAGADVKLIAPDHPIDAVLPGLNVEEQARVHVEDTGVFVLRGNATVTFIPKSEMRRRGVGIVAETLRMPAVRQSRVHHETLASSLGDSPYGQAM